MKTSTTSSRDWGASTSAAVSATVSATGESSTLRRRSRRKFLQTSAGLLATPYVFSAARTLADDAKAKNDRLACGQIGCGGQGTHDVNRFLQLNVGECVAVCDVDRKRAEEARAKQGRGKADLYDDYRKILDRKDIDIVVIGTPDHWHSKIAIEALHAGKDVYCEKPLTLTIDEGIKICQAVTATKRVFQVGTQQRSEDGNKFLTAIALAHSGRLGKIKTITCAIGGAPASGPLKAEQPPAHLNWERWLGQAPLVDYIPRRCHYEFRWWYEYSGGKMTDWGAHHVDIATWVLNAGDTGPLSIEGTAKFPVPYSGGHPTVDNAYNCPTEFRVSCRYANGAEVVVCDKTADFDNGVLIEGEKGRLFVNRGKLTGKPVDELKENPLPPDAITKLYKGKKPGHHFGNFVECVRSREQPISDVFTHHRAMTTCHLANIAIRLGRKLTWDPAAEKFVGDAEAAKWVAREQRKGYEVTA